MNPFFNIFLVILALWTVPWKIYAVWTAVKNDHKKWFIALLLLNTFGILEIYYILKVAKISWSEVEMDFRNAWRGFIGDKKLEAHARDAHGHDEHGHSHH